MTNRILTFLFCFVLFTSANAQSWKKEVESSIESLNNAMISRDKPMLDKLTAESLSYGHSTGLVENKTAFTSNILTGTTKFSQIGQTDQTIENSGDLAIVRNISTIKGTRADGLLDIKIGILMVWRKEGADWKLVARQGYKLP